MTTHHNTEEQDDEDCKITSDLWRAKWAVYIL